MTAKGSTPTQKFFWQQTPLAQSRLRRVLIINRHRSWLYGSQYAQSPLLYFGLDVLGAMPSHLPFIVCTKNAEVKKKMLSCIYCENFYSVSFTRFAFLWHFRKFCLAVMKIVTFHRVQCVVGKSNLSRNHAFIKKTQEEATRTRAQVWSLTQTYSASFSQPSIMVKWAF